MFHADLAKDFNHPVVKPPRGVAVQHAVLMAKLDVPQQPLRFGDGGVTHDLVCGQDVHSLGLSLSNGQKHQGKACESGR